MRLSSFRWHIGSARLGTKTVVAPRLVPLLFASAGLAVAAWQVPAAAAPSTVSRAAQCPEGNPNALFRVNLDSKRSVHVATARWGDYIQDLSPDGRWIAYGQAKLRVAMTDGRFARTVTSMPTRSARWSPDGKRIVFVSVDPKDSGFPIWVVNADGSGLHEIADRGMEPVWSPDSRTIAFVKPQGSGNVYSIYNARLVVAAADGTHSLDIAPTAFAPELIPARPSWSPSGNWIAYPGPHLNRLDLIHPDGSGHHVLRNHVGADATWARIGDRLVFDYFNEGPNQPEFGIIDLRGHRLRSLEHAGASFPTWSPRSAWIAYAAPDPNDTQRMQIYAIRSDGSGRRQLTNDDLIQDAVIADDIVEIAWVTRGPAAGRSIYYFRNYCTDPNP